VTRGGPRSQPRCTCPGSQPDSSHLCWTSPPTHNRLTPVTTDPHPYTLTPATSAHRPQGDRRRARDPWPGTHDTGSNRSPTTNLGSPSHRSADGGLPESAPVDRHGPCHCRVFAEQANRGNWTPPTVPAVYGFPGQTIQSRTGGAAGSGGSSASVAVRWIVACPGSGRIGCQPP